MSFKSKVDKIKRNQTIHLPKSPSDSPPHFLPKSPLDSPPLSPKSPPHSPKSPPHSPKSPPHSPKSPKSPLDSPPLSPRSPPHSPKSPLDSPPLSPKSPPHSPKSPAHSPPITKREPKYIFLSFLSHGGFGRATNPYRANKHASVSLKTLHSVPKLMTFMNCSPGGSLIGETGGMDNVVLADYFKRSADFNIVDVNNFHMPKAKTHDQLVSYSFLDYANSALNELDMRPRDRTERFKIKNSSDLDVCRNSFICDGKVGISHRFPNKSFSTNDPSIETTPGENWGVFIYNNNCDIEPGTDISTIKEIQHFTLKDKDGKVVGLDFDLADIISGLTKKYGLTEDDYLFLFDYSCNNFSTKSINLDNDPRLTRRLGRSVTSDFGLGLKKKRRTVRKTRTIRKTRKVHEKRKK